MTREEQRELLVAFCRWRQGGAMTSTHDAAVIGDFLATLPQPCCQGIGDGCCCVECVSDRDRNCHGSPTGPGGMVVEPDPTPKHRTRGGVGAVARKMRRGK